MWPHCPSPLAHRQVPEHRCPLNHVLALPNPACCDTPAVSFPQLEKKQALPPFQPQITDDYGLDNFDTQFTSEPVQLTPDDE